MMRTAEPSRAASAGRSTRRARRRAAGVRAITIRDLPADLAVELTRLRRERGLSFNRLAIQLLAERLGLAGRAVPVERLPDELDELAGAWTPEESDAFDRALADVRRVDDELWR